jgi:hypothetical protein
MDAGPLINISIPVAWGFAAILGTIIIAYVIKSIF